MPLPYADHARNCMNLATETPVGSPEFNKLGSCAANAILYGAALNALECLARDIQEQSNIGDELCAELIHETLLPNLPVELYAVFGYEK